MLHWCGIGKRSKPLEYWQAFLLHAKSEIIGVSGLYRQPGMPSHVARLGWFAIRPKFRRQGFGTAAIHQLCNAARAAGSTELWVYTGLQDSVARSFYTSLGFEVLGPASEYAPGKTTDDSDILLRRSWLSLDLLTASRRDPSDPVLRSLIEIFTLGAWVCTSSSVSCWYEQGRATRPRSAQMRC
jgi:RimJ/RimL family protein N-acetyltransferase